MSNTKPRKSRAKTIRKPAEKLGLSFVTEEVKASGKVSNRNYFDLEALTAGIDPDTNLSWYDHDMRGIDAMNELIAAVRRQPSIGRIDIREVINAAFALRMSPNGFKPAAEFTNILVALIEGAIRHLDVDRYMAERAKEVARSREHMAAIWAQVEAKRRAQVLAAGAKGRATQAARRAAAKAAAESLPLAA